MAVGLTSEGENLGKYAIDSSTLTKQQLSGNAPLPKIDLKTGEIWRGGWSRDAALIERYALQSQARYSMLEHWKANGKQGKPHRVCTCRRWLRPRVGEAVHAEVHKHHETGHTFYTGTEICASPWACPICHPKIMERRAAEIRTGVDQWAAQGGICLFVTLTVPHGIEDELKPLLERFTVALERFRSGRAFAALNRGFGRVGLIRALEVTYGGWNGWHPHTHELWFIRPEEFRAWVVDWLRSQGFVSPDGHPLPMAFCQEAAKAALYALWRNAALAAGLSEPSYAHGLDLRVASTQEELKAALADYLAKVGQELPDYSGPIWGPAEEMVRAHSKKGRKGRLTPFDFLRAQYDHEIPKAQRIRYRELFAEYVVAFRRKHPISWSNGLKARFDLEEKTDEETAQESREAADVLARLEVWQWDRLLGRVDHRATALVLAQHHGASILFEFIRALPPPEASVPFARRE